jgi:hypothetical protein
LNVHAPTDDKIDDMKDVYYEELECVFDKFPKYHLKILLRDFIAKIGREESNNNGVRVINFVTSKNLTVKCIMSPHHNINKYTWTSPDGKTHNQIDHILIHRRRHSSVLNAQSADCDTDHYLVMTKVRDRLAANKQSLQIFNMEKFNLKKLNEVESKENYRVEVRKRFVALEDLDAEVEINSACETIRENVRISA